MNKNNINFAQQVVKDREIIMTTCMLTTLEVLKESFGFNEKQVNDFSDKYLPKLKKNLQGKK